ncbi:recombinase-like helix-turn-helix domain-containing protein [Yersinia similis]|uniref:Recombinase-like domain-containing protein n=2 Tax=Yersinia similis TaxID=367190 RepID=A0A0T9QZZ5_9GAMM|nr:recombinase-like helix-turn-helix domain-containing protein [Yersinia similis]AHK18521.1 hypothetical protein BF17_03560 [Yersinia similis]CFQ69593.1 Uncharacterised protein [Yersinia similis]CNC12723.1 Uncharacterised protein [Yersinia similis]CNF22353.1 Uncharacterised protein [Yersinia similis]CNG21919.1 Uncharacterised protein [Yersinia similis]
MSKPIDDINPWLPDTQQLIPASGGGNGQIHHPGHYQNIIWQNRARVPDGFETALVATLEEIFEQGHHQLGQVIAVLNERRVFDRSGTRWTEVSFRHFLQVHGY